MELKSRDNLSPIMIGIWDSFISLIGSDCISNAYATDYDSVHVEWRKGKSVLGLSLNSVAYSYFLIRFGDYPAYTRWKSITEDIETLRRNIDNL